MTTVSLSDWEHSKENIEPLKQGRNPAKLAEMFKDAGSAEGLVQQQRKQQKLEQEKE